MIEATLEAPMTESAWEARPFYTRVAIGGMVAAVLVLVAMSILAASTGDLFIPRVLAVFWIPTAVIAGLMARYGKGAVIAGIVWTALSLLANVVFTMPSLIYVNSFFDFGFALPLLVSTAVALVASIVALVQLRRGTARTSGRIGERRTLSAIAVAVVATMALSGVLHVSSLETVSAAASAGAVRVDIKEFDFHPTDLKLLAGTPVKIKVRNSDIPVHTFTVEGLGIDHTIVSGSEKLIEFASLAPGTYELKCAVPGHEDMEGKLIVR